MGYLKVINGSVGICGGRRHDSALLKIYSLTGSYMSGEIDDLKPAGVRCEISSSHGGEYEVQNCLLGSTSV
jgi:hypothetical protein